MELKMKKWMYIGDIGTYTIVVIPGPQFFIRVLKSKVEVYKQPWMLSTPHMLKTNVRKINKIDLLQILFDRPYAINIERLIKGVELYQYEKGKI